MNQIDYFITVDENHDLVDIGIPLRWVKNDLEGSKFCFGSSRNIPELTYCGAPIEADFELSYENLIPYVDTVLRLAAIIQGPYDRFVTRVVIKNGKVKLEGNC